MTKADSSSSQGSSGSPHIDYEALYRGWVHGDVLDIGCGLGDNAVYLSKNGRTMSNRRSPDARHYH